MTAVKGPPAECFQPDEFGTPPTCTKVGGEWVVSYDEGFGQGGAADGVPGAFGVLFVIALLAGVAGTVWKVSTARRMARESGMSERDATAMALLTDDGFEATYVASNVRGSAADSPAVGAPAPASDRLAELQTLLDRGLVTQEEYAAARQRILDAL